MSLCRTFFSTASRLLPLLALLSSAALLPAQPADGSAAVQLLFKSRLALEDSQPELAENLAREVLALPEVTSTEYTDAFELTLASLAARGETAELLASLPASPSPALATWWHAKALLSSQPAAAATILRDGLPDATAELRPRFLQLLPTSLLAAGETNAALTAYSECLTLSDDIAGVVVTKLDYANLLLHLNRQEEATTLLQSWLGDRENSQSPETQQASLLLARLLLDGSDPQQAVPLLEPLLEDEAAAPDLRSAAALGLAAAADSRQDSEAARTARELARKLAITPAAQFAALADLALHLAQHESAPAALPLLDEAMQLNAPLLEVARLRYEIARTLLQQQHYSEALAEIQKVAEISTTSTLEARTQRLRGEILAQLGRPEEAAVALLRAAEVSTNELFQSACLFKAAESQRDADAHAAAAATFQNFLTRFPDAELAPRAAFLRGDSLAQQDREEAERYLLTLPELFPETPESARAVFKAAQLAADREALEIARQRYRQVIEAPAAPDELRAAATLGTGLLHFRAFQFDKARTEFERAMQSDNDTVADQAAYLRAAALYNEGLEEQSLTAATDYLSERPHSAWVPDVIYWLGCYFFNRQQFEESIRYFEKFVEDWPVRHEHDGALMWLARARYELKQHAEASAGALRLVREHPRSPLAAEARLLHGEALCELMRFDEAIIVFDELLTLHPGSESAIRALGRKGDALFTLGTDAPARYEESIATYDILLSVPELPLDSRLQAAYKIGRCHEKAGRPAMARDIYYQKVVLPFIEAKQQSQPLNDRARAWFSRAALNAAELYEKEQDWAAAIGVLLRMSRENVPGKVEALERARRLRRDHPGSSPMLPDH